MSHHQNNVPLVGLVGFARAGKSESGSFLQDQYGFNPIKPSHVVRAALIREYGERQFTRAEYWRMNEQMRQEHGPGFYLKGIDLTAHRTLIDGSRHLDTVRTIQAHGGFLIGIVARAEVRHARALAEPDGKLVPPTIEEFVREEAPEMNGLGSRGGQILPILWGMDPSHIIDTSDLPIPDMHQSIAAIMLEHGVTPIGE